MHRHIGGDGLSIGKPTPNNMIYILDQNEAPVPVGEPGLMWAGGLGVSRGYINPDLKAMERFKPDKFANDG